MSDNFQWILPTSNDKTANLKVILFYLQVWKNNLAPLHRIQRLSKGWRQRVAVQVYEDKAWRRRRLPHAGQPCEEDTFVQRHLPRVQNQWNDYDVEIYDCYWDIKGEYDIVESLEVFNWFVYKLWGEEIRKSFRSVL